VKRLLVVLAVTVAAGLGLAHRASADTYRVCGYGVTVGGIPDTCMTMSAALSAAEASSGPDTIEMFPGTYCPIDIETNVYSPIHFVGVGLAAVDTGGGPVSFSGPEAGLTTFKWDELNCGTLPSAVVKLNTFVESGVLTFQNLTIDATGGEGYGLLVENSENVGLRDVIVQNASEAGVMYTTGFSNFVDYGLDLDKSAILDNPGVGVDINGFGSVYDSTIAGNGTGVLTQGDGTSLSNDTITNNTNGVSAPCCGNNLQVVNTIVAGNVSDCNGTSDWESGPLGSWNNLLGPSCPRRVASDIAISGGLADLAENGGPTPSVLPPSQADGAGQAPCGLNGVDQREFVIQTGCDIGSVQESAVGTPDATSSPTSVNLGTIDTGVQSGTTVDVENLGGDLVGVSSVSVTGGGWSVSNDGCTYAILDGSDYCGVSVAITPGSDGDHNGTLHVVTTAGTLSISLTGDSVTRPNGMDDSYDVPGDTLNVAAPGVLANDDASTTVDEVTSPPSNGVLTGPNPDGSFTYTPDGGFIGDDSFQYTIIGSGLVESHPITVTLHVLGYTLELDHASYSAAPGGTFTIHATVTPLRGYTGTVCFDVATTTGSTWPPPLSEGAGYPACSGGGEDEGPPSGGVTLDGTNPESIDLPVNVAGDATLGDFPFEVIASAANSDAPDAVQPFDLSTAGTAPDGGGSMLADPNIALAGSTGNTIAFTYTADAGGLTSGAVTLTVPTGWSAPSVTPSAAGYTTADDGTVTVVGRKITVSGLTLSMGDTVEIDYGVMTPGPGATAPGAPLNTTQAWPAQEKSTVGGTLTALAANPTTQLDPKPKITSFVPAAGAGVGVSVTINGTGFTGATGVQFNGHAASFTVNSDHAISATVPSGATTGKVEIDNPAGSGLSALNYTIIAAPTVVSFLPTSGTVGTIVAITGTNLGGLSGVSFNGTHATVFHKVSNTSATATVPGGATTGPIAVTTPGGTGTSAGDFTVVPLPPTVTSFLPASGGVGMTVTVKGTHFTGATAVKFNGTSASTFNVVSDTQLTVVVPGGSTTGQIAVYNPANHGTSVASFTVLPLPSITTFTPSSGGVGRSVTITGQFFTGTTKVQFNGTKATFTPISAQKLIAVVPAGATSGQITVTTAAGPGTSAGTFTVVPTPKITSFTLSSGHVGDTVTITGSGFTAATIVSFNGKNASSFSVDSDTQIRVVVPTGATTGKIAVSTAGGTATSTLSFTVN
jgi:hypothetical protein